MHRSVEPGASGVEYQVPARSDFVLLHGSQTADFGSGPGHRIDPDEKAVGARGVNSAGYRVRRQGVHAAKMKGPHQGGGSGVGIDLIKFAGGDAIQGPAAKGNISNIGHSHGPHRGGPARVIQGVQGAVAVAGIGVKGVESNTPGGGGADQHRYEGEK